MPRSRHHHRPDGDTRSPLLTPMIDVMMCLLIVFMVIQPGMRRGLDLQVPPTTTEKQPAASIDRIVLHVAVGPVYIINGDAVANGTRAPRLQARFATRERRVLFVQGEGSVPFGEVIGAVDIARGAGVDVVGLVPRPDTTGRAKRWCVRSRGAERGVARSRIAGQDHFPTQTERNPDDISRCAAEEYA